MSFRVVTEFGNFPDLLTRSNNSGYSECCTYEAQERLQGKPEKKWHFQNILCSYSIAVQSRIYYFFERVPVEEGKSMFPSAAALKGGGEKRHYPCCESRLMWPMLLSLRKCWDLAALPASGLFLRNYVLSYP